MTKRILIMAGGTGGHVFPGLAVGKALQKQGWEVHWLGTSERLEATLVPKAGFPISYIDVAGVRGNGLVRLLQAPFKILHSIMQARKVIHDFKPDVVMGMGGFASGPGGIAAWTMGVPLLLHEQNAVAGMTNRILARFANKVFCGFDNTFAEQHGNPDKFRWVGNPVREEFNQLPARAADATGINLLIVGGSLGAQTLNVNVPEALTGLQDIQVRHQCGAGHAETVTQAYRSAVGDAFEWQVNEFIDDIAAAYAWADLVICRAGALTVAEVAASGRCAVFVPLPHAVDDHQTRNAQSLASFDAAYLLPQQELEQGGLVPILQAVAASPDILTQKGRKARQLAKTDALDLLTSACVHVAGEAA